jgi:iron complex transport system substrate-binding protein
MPPDRRGPARSRPLVRSAALVLSLVAAACGGAPAAAPSDVAPGPDGFPRLVETPLGGPVVVPARPVRIVPANAPAADFVLALVGEAGRDRIALVSPETIAYSHLATTLAPWGVERAGAHSAEFVLAARPDLVLDADWQDAGTRGKVVRAGVPVATLPTVVSEAELWSNLTLVGRLLGEEERAAALVAELTDRVAALRERGTRRAERVLFYANLGSGGSAAGRGTTSDLVLDLCGLANAADRLDGHAACGHELLIVLAPDWIVVGEASAGEPGATRRHLESHTDLAVLTAVAEGRIVELPRTLATSSSHTLVDAAEALLDELDRIDPPDRP